jgi:hypothetical protein
MISIYVRTLWLLIRFDIILRTQSFGTLYRRVQTYPLRDNPSPPIDADWCVTAFERACIWYPKRVRCLQRSAALTCLLRKNGIPARMAIGTQKFPFKAHAWVEVNERVVSDKEYLPEMYAVLDRC